MLLEILKQLISEVEEGNAPLKEICAYVGDHGTGEDELKLHDLFLLWPGFSGNRLFPIPCPDGGRAIVAWMHTPAQHRYDVNHPYGAERMDFLHWAVEYLENTHG